MNPPTLIPETYQTYGKKAYWLFLSQWLGTPITFLIIAFIFSIARRSGMVSPDVGRYVAMATVCLVGISVLGFAIAIVGSRVAYNSRKFCLSGDALKIRTGFMTQNEIAIPYRQIQNVALERTLSQRMMGVSRMVVVTAGQDDPSTDENESKAILTSIDRELAAALQDELLRRADLEKVVQAK